MNERMEYYSASPEEIRFDLGLPPEATQGEVVVERWERLKASQRAISGEVVLDEKSIADA